ncbi:acyl-CoA thioesterase [Novosphingobium aerophilum]|uniref:acyl-CoA thioesterase n=1 Tax=Novosphingobium TaxID=165696 RepID=UPI0012C5E63F|nr:MULTISPECIES: acyl-CoA thioesterase [unclassified Novosphingobium]MPS67467.1 acyl-CoA thioesterase [Novosphingobium sp.]WRT93264.1 acyl-CoA thioesterase [Novosphingobium sp. RL4]
MAKPDPALLDPARYPFSCRIEPRFGDLDLNMHINNVAMAGMLEDARVRFFREAGGHKHLAGLSTMVASISIDYLGETHYPDAVTVHGAIEKLGRTSQQVVQVVMQGDSPVVFARTVIVMVGLEGPAPLTDGYLENAGPWMFRA